MRNKILLISLSRESTGEVRFWVTATKLLQKNKDMVTLITNPRFKDLFSDFPGTLSFYDFSSKNAWSGLFSHIKSIISQFKKIVLLDITSATLENNLSCNELNRIIEDLEKTGCKVSLFDVMAVIEKSQDIYNNRLKSTETKLQLFINDYISHKSHSTSQFSYYFSRFLKRRTINQLLIVPDNIEIIRTTPYTYKKENDQSTYLRCNFEKINVNNNSSKKIILGFSKFADRVVSKDALSDLLSHVVIKMKKLIGIEKIVLINPVGIDVDEIGEKECIKIENYNRIERKTLLKEMESAYFVAFFIPTASVGITAIQNGIPFISLYSSKFSSQYLTHKKTEEFIPRFTSLGIWEDAAFIDYLKEDDNHYFNTVEFIDISDESQFIDLNTKLETGKIAEKIKAFNNINCSVKPFSEFVES